MKKIVIVASVFAILAPGVGSALTSEELLAQVQQLIQQVQSLQAKTQPQNTVPSSSASSADASGGICPAFSKTLQKGAKGSDVSALQKFLAQDPAIYAGEITGFFGPATEAALKKWQAKNGVVSSGSAQTTGWGVLGGKTRAAIAAKCFGASSNPSGSSVDVIPGIKLAASCPNVDIAVKPCAGVWEAVKDTNGCLKEYVCKQVTSFATSSCEVSAANLKCSAGVLTPINVDSRGCAKSYECVVQGSAKAAPVMPAVPTTSTSVTIFSCPVLPRVDCQTGYYYSNGVPDANGCKTLGSCVLYSSLLSPESGKAPLATRVLPPTDWRDMIDKICMGNIRPDAAGASYGYSINWGDGTVTTGSTAELRPADGNLCRLHTYTMPGSYPVTALVSYFDGRDSHDLWTAGATATVF